MLWNKLWAYITSFPLTLFCYTVVWVSDLYEVISVKLFKKFFDILRNCIWKISKYHLSIRFQFSCLALYTRNSSCISMFFGGGDDYFKNCSNQYTTYIPWLIPYFLQPTTISISGGKKYHQNQQELLVMMVKSTKYVKNMKHSHIGLVKYTLH